MLLPRSPSLHYYRPLTQLPFPHWIINTSFSCQGHLHEFTVNSKFQFLLPLNRLWYSLNLTHTSSFLFPPNLLDLKILSSAKHMSNHFHVQNVAALISTVSVLDGTASVSPTGELVWKMFLAWWIHLKFWKFLPLALRREKRSTPQPST